MLLNPTSKIASGPWYNGPSGLDTEFSHMRCHAQMSCMVGFEPTIVQHESPLGVLPSSHMKRKALDCAHASFKPSLASLLTLPARVQQPPQMPQGLSPSPLHAKRRQGSGPGHSAHLQYFEACSGGQAPCCSCAHIGQPPGFQRLCLHLEPIGRQLPLTCIVRRWTLPMHL